MGRTARKCFVCSKKLLGYAGSIRILLFAHPSIQTKYFCHDDCLRAYVLMSTGQKIAHTRAINGGSMKSPAMSATEAIVAISANNSKLKAILSIWEGALMRIAVGECRSPEHCQKANAQTCSICIAREAIQKRNWVFGQSQQARLRKTCQDKLRTGNGRGKRGRAEWWLNAI